MWSTEAPAQFLDQETKVADVDRSVHSSFTFFTMFPDWDNRKTEIKCSNISSLAAAIVNQPCRNTRPKNNWMNVGQ